MLQGKIIASSSIANVIPIILEQLQNFRCTEITHARQEGSKLARRLAKHAKFMFYENTCSEEICENTCYGI